jgi:hypothetical protein
MYKMAGSINTQLVVVLLAILEAKGRLTFENNPARRNSYQSRSRSKRKVRFWAVHWQ